MQCLSEPSVEFLRTTRRCNPEESILYNPSLGNFRSYVLTVFTRPAAHALRQIRPMQSTSFYFAKPHFNNALSSNSTSSYFSVFFIVSRGTMLRAGRSRDRVPRSLIFFFNLPDPSGSTMALGLTQPLTETSTRKYFSGEERGQLVRLTASPPPLSRLSIQCGILDVSQTFRSLRPLQG
jgi:hypothetical protein